VQHLRGDRRLTPLYHGRVMLEFGGTVIHVEPWRPGRLQGLPHADLIAITQHTRRSLDRSANATLLINPDTRIVRPPRHRTLILSPGVLPGGDHQTTSTHKTVMGSCLAGVPMYNLVQACSAGQAVPVTKASAAGTVCAFVEPRVYFSVDTDCTPEMER